MFPATLSVSNLFVGMARFSDIKSVFLRLIGCNSAYETGVPGFKSW